MSEDLTNIAPYGTIKAREYDSTISQVQESESLQSSNVAIDMKKMTPNLSKNSLVNATSPKIFNKTIKKESTLSLLAIHSNTSSVARMDIHLDCSAD